MQSPVKGITPYVSPRRPVLRRQVSTPLEELKWRSLSFTKPKWRTEAKLILTVGLPVAFTISGRLLQVATDQAVLGHLGTKYLAASSLGSVWMSLSGSYMYAFTSTINTLASQAYGAQNYKLVSQYYQMGILLCFFAVLPVIAAWFQTEPILKFFGVKSNIARLAAKFSMWSAIYVIPNIQYMAVRMYFKSQSIVNPAAAINFVSFFINAVAAITLVYGLGSAWGGLGFIGGPIATDVTRIMSLIIYCIYMFGYKKYHSKTWSPLNIKNLYITYSCKRANKFIKLAIPIVISSALEDWQLQIITLFVGQLNNSDVASFSSMITILLCLHCFVIGLGEGVGVRVGNLLGRGLYREARYTSFCGITMAILFSIVTTIILISLGGDLGKLVSHDREVIKKYAQFTPMLGAGFVFLSILSLCMSILVACAKPLGLAICALISCWGISVPLSYVLGITLNYRLWGIWWGIMIGYVVFTATSAFLVYRIDWKQASKDAIKRSEKKEEEKNKMNNSNSNNKTKDDKNEKLINQYIVPVTLESDSDDENNIRDDFMNDTIDNDPNNDLQLLNDSLTNAPLYFVNSQKGSLQNNTNNAFEA